MIKFKSKWDIFGEKFEYVTHRFGIAYIQNLNILVVDKQNTVHSTKISIFNKNKITLENISK